MTEEEAYEKILLSVAYDYAPNLRETTKGMIRDTIASLVDEVEGKAYGRGYLSGVADADNNR